MSENRNRGIRDFSRYDSMATEDLEQILRLDAEAPQSRESDTQLLLYVMGVLADRKRNSDSTGYTAREAFESFQRDYLPCGGEADDFPQTVAMPDRSPARWRRSLTAAAAVLAVVLCCAFTAKALGYDIWNAVAVWAQETFHFSSGEQTQMREPTPSDGVEYTSFQELLMQNGIDTKLVPTWLPEGYVLDDIRVTETPAQEIFIAYYTYNEESIKITVRSYHNSDPEQIEKSDDLVKIQEISGTNYYIFENFQQSRVVWIRDTYECYISGKLTIDELINMIKSIEEG